MSRVHLSEDQFNAFWAMVGAVVLIPSAFMWMRRRLDTQSVKDRWREVDRIARNRRERSAAMDTSEHDEQLYAAHNEIVADMPGPIRDSYNQILLPLMADLGESPEAWRGGVRVGMEIMRGLSADLDEDEHDPRVLSARQQFILLLLIGVINSPWGRTALEANRNSGEARMRQMVDEVMRGMIGEVFE